MNNKYILLFVFFILLFSCSSDVEYERNVPVSCYGWGLYDTLNFNIDISDLNKQYDLYINLRHRDVYKYMNIYVKIVTELPDGYKKNEVISLPLCDESGKWYGKCTGDICSNRILIMKKIKFDQKGVYKFKINHEMRINKLRNILDIGLLLKEHKKKVYDR